MIVLCLNFERELPSFRFQKLKIYIHCKLFLHRIVMRVRKVGYGSEKYVLGPPMLDDISHTEMSTLAVANHVLVKAAVSDRIRGQDSICEVEVTEFRR